MSPISQLPILLLAGLLFYGAFSRLTHGVYTPAFYAYQTERQPDDGSTAAVMPPLMDLTLGTSLLVGNPRFKIGASALFALAQTYGLVLMMQQGHDFRVDAAMLALSVVAGVSAGLGEGRF